MGGKNEMQFARVEFLQADEPTEKMKNKTREARRRPIKPARKASSNRGHSLLPKSESELKKDGQLAPIINLQAEERKNEAKNTTWEAKKRPIKPDGNASSNHDHLLATKGEREVKQDGQLAPIKNLQAEKRKNEAKNTKREAKKLSTKPDAKTLSVYDHVLVPKETREGKNGRQFAPVDSLQASERKNDAKNTPKPNSTTRQAKKRPAKHASKYLSKESQLQVPVVEDRGDQKRAGADWYSGKSLHSDVSSVIESPPRSLTEGYGKSDDAHFAAGIIKKGLVGVETNVETAAIGTESSERRTEKYGSRKGPPAIISINAHDECDTSIVVSVAADSYVQDLLAQKRTRRRAQEGSSPRSFGLLQ